MTRQKIEEESPGFEELKKSWLTRARDVRTVGDMQALVRELAEDYEHSYGTICHAMTTACLAAFYALERSPEGGITGAQAHFVAAGFIREFLRIKGPFKVLEYEHLLFPQYESEFRTIPKSLVEWLKTEAAKLLEKPREHEIAEEVTAHWRRLAAGELPFGLTAGER